MQFFNVFPVYLNLIKFIYQNNMLYVTHAYSFINRDSKKKIEYPAERIIT